MYPYLIIYTLSSLFALFTRSRAHAKALVAVLTVFLVFFVGSRFQVGCDYTGYANRFASLKDFTSWGEIFSDGEAGFHLLSLAIKDLGLSFSALLFVSAVIYMLCLWRFSRVLDKPLGFIALCFPVMIVQLGMSGIRQALAVGFLMLALAAFTRKQRLTMAVWVLVASQFHTSAIVFLPLVYLVGRDVSIARLVAAMAVIGPVVAWFIGERMQVYSDRYIEQIYGENSAGGAWIRYMLILVPFLFFEWRRRQVQLLFPALYPLLRLFSLITLALVIVGMVSSVALHRLIFFVMPISIVASLCVSKAMPGRNSAQLLAVMPYLLYGAYLTFWAELSRHAQLCYAPYQTWLF